MQTTLTILHIQEPILAQGEEKKKRKKKGREIHRMLLAGRQTQGWNNHKHVYADPPPKRILSAGDMGIGMPNTYNISNEYTAKGKVN